MEVSLWMFDEYDQVFPRYEIRDHGQYLMNPRANLVQAKRERLVSGIELNVRHSSARLLLDSLYLKLWEEYAEGILHEAIALPFRSISVDSKVEQDARGVGAGE